MADVVKNALDPDDIPKWVSSFWNNLNYGNVIAGINDDDCAVVKIGKEIFVISVDYLNANPIAFELGIGSFKDLGRIMVAANLSDLCGSGAKPVSFLAGVMFKKPSKFSDFTDFMKGVKYELKKHKVPLVGGDTKLGNSNSFFGVAVGVKERKTKLFLKNGAMPGDNIWVSGNLGSVGASIVGLRSKTMPKKWNEWAKKKIVNPILPLKVSRSIAKKHLANSGTDISDGLGADLFSLCKSSNVGAIIEVEKIPIHSNLIKIASKQKMQPWYFPFTVGGDFQFLITANSRKDKELLKIGLIKIGVITKNKNCYILYNGEKREMPKIGHRDSRSKNFSQEMMLMLANLKKNK